MLTLRLISLRRISTIITCLKNMHPLIHKTKATNSNSRNIDFEHKIYNSFDWDCAYKYFLEEMYVSACACRHICLHSCIMLQPQSNFFISEAQTDTHTALCLSLHSRVRLAHHICPVGWREVYLIFMAVRPLRAGVTTEEWSKRGLRLAKTLTSTPKNISEKLHHPLRKIQKDVFVCHITFFFFTA